MARLFVTQREINFINDLNKEVIKDIIGQRIFYYPVSEIKTLAHSVYAESPEKIFDNPIEIDALIDNPVYTNKFDQFGYDLDIKLNVFLHRKDIIDKGIQPSQGDFFTYGDIIYEVTQVVFIKNIFGQIEHYDGIQLVATNSRVSQAKVKFFGPTEIGYSDEDATVDQYYQQRGDQTLPNGIQTGDTRDLVKTGVLEKPITGGKEISEKGITDNDNNVSSFYGDKE